MCYVNCSPNGLAALRRARFARFASVQRPLESEMYNVHFRRRGIHSPCVAFICLFGTWFGAAFACYEYIRTDVARMQQAALAAS